LAVRPHEIAYCLWSVSSGFLRVWWVYINFSKAGYWVHVRSLEPYLCYKFEEARSGQRMFARMLCTIWAPSWRRTLTGVLHEIEEQAGELGVHPGWIRFPTSGSRIQVFDRHGERICKICTNPVAPVTIEAEIEVRSRVMDLGPSILGVSRDGLALVENWVHGSRAIYTMENGIRAVSRLRESLYVVENVVLNQISMHPTERK